MTLEAPRDPFSEVVDERRRWMPDWYSWLQTLISGINTEIAGLNTGSLSDYTEGTWVPTITFDTPGDLSVVYTTQFGIYRKIGTLIHVAFNIATSTFTHTTAAGNLHISLPFQPATTPAINQRTGTLYFQGITKVNYTQFVVSFENLAGPFAIVDASGSAQALSVVTAADMPTGGTVELRGGGTYATSS